MPLEDSPLVGFMQSKGVIVRIQFLLLGLMLALASYGIVLPNAFAAPPIFVANGSPPETPDYTYHEILACLARANAFKMPSAAFKTANEECAAKTQGLTLQDYFAMFDGCVQVLGNADKLKADCDSAIDKKLKPLFVVGGSSFSALELTVNELTTLKYGCTQLSDVKDKLRCQNGLEKLRKILQTPLPEPRPIDPPISSQEYIGIVKENPHWINSPKGDSLWLMDPMGRVVHGKDGSPISTPIN